MFGYLRIFGIDEGLLSHVLSLHRWSIATSTWLLRRLSLVPGLAAAVVPSMDSPSDTSSPDTDKSSTGALQFGCNHYKRRCKLVAPCCDAVVWCRHCHNHIANENEPVSLCATPV
jgi:hypothetical protein